jgi:hypothetical protein
MKIVRTLLLIVGGLGIAWAAQESGEPPESVEQLSQEEMDAEMERIEEALGESDEVVEFIPTKPLAADLPVALPSDI